MYTPALRGKYPKPSQPPVPSLDMGSAMNMGQMMYELKQLKKILEDTLITANSKLQEVDSQIQTHLDNIENTSDNSIKRIIEATDSLEQTKNQAIETIKSQVPIKSELPTQERIIYVEPKIESKNQIDTEQLKQDILAQIPKLDEKALIKKILQAIPKNKASLKVIQEKIEIDPMSVIEQIMALPTEKLKKFKLKKENIDGLEQTMSAFNSQLGRGYLHGGGDTVQAGTNITISRTSAGKTVINASGGAGANWTGGSFTGDGVTTVFNLPTTATSFSSVFLKLNGQGLTDQNILAVGYDYTLGVDLKTITMVTAPDSTDLFTFNYS